VFDTIPFFPFQPLLWARPPHLKCDQPPRLHTHLWVCVYTHYVSHLRKRRAILCPAWDIDSSIIFSFFPLSSLAEPCVHA
jgi:hypothetical protein